MNSPYNLNPLGGLVLARLAVARKKPLSANEVREALQPFIGHLSEAQSREAWESTLDYLRSKSLMSERAMALTDAGRMAAAQFLGVPAISPRLTWATIKSKYLICKALDLSLSEKEQAKIAQADGLRAAIIAKHFNLVVGPVPTKRQAMACLAWKELGKETTQPLGCPAVVALVVGRLLQSDKELEYEQVFTRLPRVLVHVTGSDVHALRNTIIASWIKESSLPSEQPPEAHGHREEQSLAARVRPIQLERLLNADLPPTHFDLDAFARRVQSIAHDSPSGRFGRDAVFISHIWREFQHDALARDMDEAAFKRRLVEANRRGLLRLSRADTVELMPPQDVAESEIDAEIDRFHFVRL
jgi:hypothetical protein